MTVYIAIIGLCWVVFLISWAIFAMTFGSSGRNYYTPGGRAIRLLFVVAIFLAVGYGRTLTLRPFGELTLDVAAAGAALCIVGLAFAIWARVALGRSWGMPMTQHEDPDLVTSGPYRFVRHPIYTGLSAMMIGTALVHPLAALPCLCMVGYSVFSAFREERDMERRFPGAYSDYKKSSKMLVPFLL
jgi:protein-S-isoprenylcysteine O-methyltransferase Ste14